MIDVGLLEQKDSQEYEGLVRKSSAGMFYHSLRYRDLLNDFMEDARPLYLIARCKGKIVGALPSFIKENVKLGNILNSLPFFGSMGGFLVDEDLPGELKSKVREALLTGFDDIAKASSCVLSTIITSPFDEESRFYDGIKADFRDTRICQIVKLPDKDNEFREKLLSLFESSGIRNIKKAQASGVEVVALPTVEGIQELFKLHSENISAKGGIVKPIAFFEKVLKRFRPDDDFQVYLGKRDGDVISGLLVFYYEKVVEYYTPATRFEYRNLQAMPLIIYRGMVDALEKGYRFWNFGGTWLSQKELYRFKKKWGAADYPYRYIIRRYGDIGRILDLSPEALGEEYRWFYVVPHSKLEKRK